MIQHLEVGLLEQIIIRIIIVQGRDEEGVDAEEGAELGNEILLLDVGSRGRRDPKFLRVALRGVKRINYCDSIVDETKSADYCHADCEETGCKRVRGRKIANLEEDFV